MLNSNQDLRHELPLKKKFTLVKRKDIQNNFVTKEQGKAMPIKEIKESKKTTLSQLLGAALYASRDEPISSTNLGKLIRKLHNLLQLEFELRPLPASGLFKLFTGGNINLKKTLFKNQFVEIPYWIEKSDDDTWSLNVFKELDNIQDHVLIIIPDKMQEAAMVTFGKEMDKLGNIVESVRLLGRIESNHLPKDRCLLLNEFYESKISPLLLTDTRDNFLNRLTKILNDSLRSISYPPSSNGRAPPVIVKLYGSSVNNLGFRNSDADLCIIDPSCSPNHPFSNMRKVGRVLERFYSNIIVIANARVPIVKFYDSKTKIECDINFNHALGVSNSHLLASYTFLDPRVRPLIMLVKYFVKCRNINDASMNTISSYAYTLMVLAFLHNRGTIKNLQEAYEGPRQIVTVAGINLVKRGSRYRKNQGRTSFRSVDVSFQSVEKAEFHAENIDWISKDGVANLFLEFLEYFGNKHHYIPQYAVSIKDGGIKILPAIDNNLLVVLDPFETDRNCTKMVNSAGLSMIKREFQTAIKHLKIGNIESIFRVSH